jgi:hypothetical protein
MNIDHENDAIRTDANGAADTVALPTAEAASADIARLLNINRLVEKKTETADCP